MVRFFVIFFMCFHTLPENWPFPLAFVVPLDTRGGLGAPLGPPVAPSGALGRHQIVDISLVLKA